MSRRAGAVQLDEDALRGYWPSPNQAPARPMPTPTLQ
jgi:hypothetical protein